MGFEPNAPKFHWLWQRMSGRRIFVVPCPVWDQVVKLEPEAKVRLELEQGAALGLDGLLRSAQFQGALASREGERVEITVWRLDPKDAPTPYNRDTYAVHRGLPSDLDVPHMVQAASTSFDANFDAYRYRHVFLVGEPKGPGHWSSELPKELVVSIKNVRT